MPCLDPWPLESLCGSHGACVFPDGTSASLSPLADTASCVCESASWSGAADFVATDGLLCLTNTIAIRAMWSLTLLLGLYTWIIAWWTLVTSWRKFIRTARADSNAALAHIRSQTSGSVPADSEVAAGDGSRSSDGGVPTCCDCGEGCWPNLEKSWASVPTRFSMFAAVTGPCITGLAIMKLSVVAMVGTSTAATLLGSIGLLFFWLSAFNGLHGFVKLNVSILQIHFNAEDQERISRHMRLFMIVLAASFTVFISAAVGVQYAMLAHPENTTDSERSYRDALAIVFCCGQAGQSVTVAFAMHYMARSIITILTAGQSIEAIHASQLATAVGSSGARPAQFGASKGTTVIVLTVSADPLSPTNGANGGFADRFTPGMAVSSGGPPGVAPPGTVATAGPASPPLSPTHRQPARTMHISPERLEFAERLQALANRIVGLTRNQFVIYMLFAFVPILRYSLTYQSPFSWSMACLGQIITIRSLTAASSTKPARVLPAQTPYPSKMMAGNHTPGGGAPAFGAPVVGRGVGVANAAAMALSSAFATGHKPPGAKYGKVTVRAKSSRQLTNHQHRGSILSPISSVVDMTGARGIGMRSGGGGGVTSPLGGSGGGGGGFNRANTSDDGGATPAAVVSPVVHNTTLVPNRNPSAFTFTGAAATAVATHGALGLPLPAGAGASEPGSAQTSPLAGYRPLVLTITSPTLADHATGGATPAAAAGAGVGTSSAPATPLAGSARLPNGGGGMTFTPLGTITASPPSTADGPAPPSNAVGQPLSRQLSG